MKAVTTIGVDLVKSVFQVHGAAKDGSVIFRKKLTRKQFARFMAKQPDCLVAMEACVNDYYWGRGMKKLGHEVTDAEAIVEAVLRPKMHFVALKSKEYQARDTLFRTRELLLSQRTQMINAL